MYLQTSTDTLFEYSQFTLSTFSFHFIFKTDATSVSAGLRHVLLFFINEATLLLSMFGLTDAN